MRAVFHMASWLAFALVLSIFGGRLKAQDVKRADLAAEADQNYGPEIDLVKGEKYFYPYNRASGDPFFNKEEGWESVIWIEGRAFEGQHIRYDLYNQMLVLEYTGSNKTKTSIVLDNDRIDRFTLGDFVFRKFELADGKEQFGHLVFEGGISCVFFWYKDLDYELINGEKQDIFSGQRANMFLLRDGSFYPFRSKRSFLNGLPEEERHVAKAILKQNKVRIRRVSVRRMFLVMDYLEKERNEAS